jgi:hypothetical protein
MEVATHRSIGALVAEGSKDGTRTGLLQNPESKLEKRDRRERAGPSVVLACLLLVRGSFQSAEARVTGWAGGPQDGLAGLH